ncbi:outer membrane beta-barrel protein [Chryseosolibacter indicus]|uniref:Outer membrane beta-barrel protein n=1 Tax=Chryseosolibacter indicus TaxID=2782351 RepID=A0ABS5VZ69_9BACT|nr:outer membrane beta-barrel protein [Chryseosolibacter indicus]MBT1706054.1 outer membrane beta-barrel protein [Chryseosolibacter indicus]
MRSFLLLAMLCLAVTTLTAQKISVKGHLVDTLNAPMPSATILLLNPKDSSLVNFKVTDAKGFFEIKNLAINVYLVKVMYIGFKTYLQKIEAEPNSTEIDLGKIKMQPANNELEAIEIEADRAPVTVKRDTIEFNAGSFKTKENAVVEDLLKKLPGVEVDSEGNIRAQGEQVQKITVDEKEFFGTDPKLATRNLPAEAVNKVQLFDTKSDQAAFSGIDDGKRLKTINLELKEEKRKGAFGTFKGGVGTDDRFQVQASVNKFSKTKQFSFLGMANNVNELGFSITDYMNFTGGSQQLMRGGPIRIEVNNGNQDGVPLDFGNRANGIMSTYAGGLNFNNEFNSKTEVRGSYFFNYLDHNTNQTTVRENFLPDGAFRFNQSSAHYNANINHRANVILDHKFDSANSLKLTTTITYNETETNSRSISNNLNEENIVTNGSERLSLAKGINVTLNTSLLWRHRFARKGRTLSANLQYGLTSADRNGKLDARNTYYEQQQPTDVINQVNEQQNMANNYSSTVSYTEPLGNRKYLEANYTFRQALNEVDREVYDLNNGEENFNAQLSNKYNSNYQYHRPGLNFRIVRSNYNFLIGGSFQLTNLSGEMELQDADISRSFQNVLPALRFNYDFSSTKHLIFNYETSVQEPSIQQLQPVLDNSDPLNLYVGNAKLRPAYSQVWRLMYTTFNPAKLVNFFASVNLDYTTNAITNAQYIDEQLVRTSTPVNVENNMNFSSNFNLGFPLEKLKSRLDFSVNFSNQKTIAVLNDLQNEIYQYVMGGVARYNFTYKEVFNLDLSADLSRQLLQYQFDQPNQTFTNLTYVAQATLSFLQNFQFGANFEYLTYENKATNFNPKIPLLNLSLSKLMLRDNKGELRFSVNNMLDEAMGVSQTATINYLEQQTTNSLGRYFTISFIYSLNKQLNPMGRVPRGNAIRMRR